MPFEGHRIRVSQTILFKPLCKSMEFIYFSDRLAEKSPANEVIVNRSFWSLKQ